MSLDFDLGFVRRDIMVHLAVCGQAERRGRKIGHARRRPSFEKLTAPTSEKIPPAFPFVYKVSPHENHGEADRPGGAV
jgi:hypothetical protein